MADETCSTCTAKAVYFLRDENKMFYSCDDHSQPVPIAGKEWKTMAALGGGLHAMEKRAAESHRPPA